MILQGDNMKIMPTLAAESFNTCVTSPPYWGLRDYGIPPTEWPEVTYTPMLGLAPVTMPAWTGCLGLEPSPDMFVAHSVLVFREVWRLLKSDGTLWMNYGDSYAGSGKGAWKNKDAQKEIYVPDPDSELSRIQKNPHGLKNKDLIGIPWRVAFALQADGWYLRMDNIWSKPNCMPESVQDRPTKAHEYFFFFSKSEKYYYDKDSIMEPLAESSINRISQDLERQNGSVRANGGAKTNGNMKAVFTVRGSKGVIDNPLNKGLREEVKTFELPHMRNKRSVWTVPTAQFSEAHFAIFPEKLIEPCILAGAPVGGHVLDPFGGSGTTLKVALENGRECTIIEMGPQYVEIAERRTAIIQQHLF
ncbi:site-specific DNA-methyltransferase [Paenibacillus sp. FSL R7-0048]|uniref:DNA-methyltransferase n=1 Tax=Paenibacillus sp. FSL R7-0048 TaxID=2954528 RepID=UPI0030FAEE32